MQSFSKLFKPILTLLVSVSVTIPAVATPRDFPTSSSPPTSLPLLGGSPIDLSTSPVALILTRKFACSGILVGSREVLTAGHCTFSAASDYLVIVGTRKYQVAAVFTHSQYNNAAPVTVNSIKFDLGMMVLTDDVTDIAPVPILRDLRVARGVTGVVIGRGTNEDQLTAATVGQGRIGSVRISDVNGSILATSEPSSFTSTCSGDSGGPLFQTVAGVRTVIGIVSAGTNRVSEEGVCQRVSSGVSLYVDLQSDSTRSFLNQFGDLSVVSGKRLLFIEGLNGIAQKLSSARTSRELSALSAQASKLRSLADSKRLPLLSSVIRSLKAAAAAKAAAQRNGALTKVSTALNQLLALGLTE